MQVIHVFDPNESELDSSDDFRLGQLMNEGESILFSEECPHPLSEEELQRGQSQSSLGIQEAINSVGRCH